jgi:ribosomal protein S12 methylthiotransferase
MDGQVSEKVKKARFHRAMALQQKVSRQVMRSFVGRELRVLVEKAVEDVPKGIWEAARKNGGMGEWGNGDLRSDDVRGQRPAHNGASWWRGRSHADAPEIDGAVFVRGDVRAGEFARVKIVGATEYDLAGEVVRTG